MNIEKNNRINQSLSTQSKNCYPGTNVLINYFGTKDANELEVMDGAIAAYKLSQMGSVELPFEPTIDYYLAIHKYIFGMIYPFAGQIRDENIQKSNEPYVPNSVTPFCRPEYIYDNLKKLLEQLKSECHFWTNEQQMIQRLAYYYGEINVIHPFREGNGRTQREFFRQLMSYLNLYLPFGQYELDYSKAKDNDQIRLFLVKGSIECALTGKTLGLELFINSCLVRHHKELKK